VLADEDVEEDPDRWCSYTECGQELWQIACQPCPFRDGCGTCGSRLGRPCKKPSCARSSGHPPKRPSLCSSPLKSQLRSMDRGSGPQHPVEPLDASGPMPSLYKRTESSAVQQAPACG
jgi:hypothetical protein